MSRMTYGAGVCRNSIISFGAVGDGETLNTTRIQETIDHCAEQGGGTVVVPEGIFVSGALFLRPGVHLHLEKGAVLQCSTEMTHFPEQRTRIEGHFEEQFNPALINADGCDGLTISGEGTLDGAGKPIWDEFWTRRSEVEDQWNFKNLDVARARLCLIENAQHVTVKGITFKDAQFWNLHLYRCQDVVVEEARFVVPDDDHPPSSDGVDVDSCQKVTIRGCYFSVNDDCVALKGTKGPFALEDQSSPPVESVRVEDCAFKRGHHAITCGSEATVVRDVVVENCRILGEMPLLRFKLRPDTPQCYEHFVCRHIEIQSEGATLFDIEKWTQYFDLMGQPEPVSTVRNICVSEVSGRIGSLGIIEGNDKTQISDIRLQNISVNVQCTEFKVDERVADLTVENVRLNGAAFLSVK